MIHNQRQVSIIKDDGHTYIFRYRLGEEALIIAALPDLAMDPETSFDWIDGAVVASRVAAGKVSVVIGDVE